MTYERAAGLVRSSRTGVRKVANNTYMREVSDGIAVRLHRTDVVVIHPDSTYTLSSGGWRTGTTKNRINQFTGAGIFQRRGDWFLSDDSPFSDGMRIPSIYMGAGPGDGENIDRAARDSEAAK